MQDVKESDRLVLDAAAALALLRDSAGYGSAEQTYMNLYAAYPDEQSRAALASAAEILKSEVGGPEQDRVVASAAAGRNSALDGGRDQPSVPEDGDARKADNPDAATAGSQNLPAAGAPQVRALPSSVPSAATSGIVAVGSQVAAETLPGVSGSGQAISAAVSPIVPFLQQIESAEISALAVGDAESRSWREPVAKVPSFQERAQIAASAIASGAASGAVQGVVSALVAAAIKKGSTKIPMLGVLIESGVIAEDPDDWLAAAVDGSVGAAFRALEEMKLPGFTARLDAILAMTGAAAACTGTLATIFEVVALALAVGGVILTAAGVGAALAAAAPLFFKAGLVLGGVAGLLLVGQGAIRASLLGVSTISLLVEQSSADEVSAKAAILESSASGFVRSIVITRTNAASVGAAGGNSASAVGVLTSGSRAGSVGASPSGGGSSDRVTAADRVRLRMASAVLDVQRFQAEKANVRQNVEALRNPDVGATDALAEGSVLYSPVVGSGTRMLAAEIAARQIEAAGQLLKGAADFVSGPEAIASDEAEVNRAAAAHMAAVRDAAMAAEIQADAAGRLERFNIEKANALKLADESRALGTLVGATVTDAAARKTAAQKGVGDADAMKAQAASTNDSGDIALMKQLAGYLALVPGAVAPGASAAAGNAACVADTASAIVASGADICTQAEMFSAWFSQSVEAIAADEQRLATAAASSREATDSMLASAEECQAGADSFAELAAMAAQAASQKTAESEQEKQNSDAARARLAEWAAGVQSSSSAVETEASVNLDAAAAALAAEDQS